ncbi:MAG: alpha/beta fold hydrolase [Planctomycetes bacterium]|nr:alpha/beta fold hydrolase [Planctomycetota bacterium]
MHPKITVWAVTVLLGAGVCPAHGPEPVFFSTEDGLDLVGTYYAPDEGTNAPVVILLHMYRSDRSAWDPILETLHSQGLAVLAIDLRGHGQSIHPTSMDLKQKVAARDEATFRAMWRDVMAAYAWLTEQPNVDLSRLALVGASVGCSVAIDYAARDRSVDVVVCMTPGEKYLGVDSRKHIAEYAKHSLRPILLLATEKERQACDALGKIHKSADVHIVGPGKVHGTRMFGQIDGIEDQMAEFLVKHLGQPGQKPVAAAVDGAEYFDLDSALDIDLEPGHRRLFTSATEAKARGLRRAPDPEAAKIVDGLDPVRESAP